MIHLKHIHIEFGRVLLQDEVMDISYGQITGLIGESGSGKTSLLQEIGLLTGKHHMEYVFDDICVNKEKAVLISQLKRNEIAFITQNIDLFDDLSIKENLELFASLVNKVLIDEDIYKFIDYVNLSLDIHTPIATLSGGERQRVAIACGLIKDAQLFIFDEPTAYLDYTNKQFIIDIMKKLAYEENKMVIVATHDQELWEHLDTIYTISNQKLEKTKGKDYQDISKEKAVTSFHFSTLKNYIRVMYRKKKVLYISIGLLLAGALSLIVFFSTYMQNYQLTAGESLLDLLGYEVNIIHDDKATTPANQRLVKDALYDYSVYPFYPYIGSISTGNNIISEVSIIPYLPDKEDSLKVLEKTNKDSTFDDFKTTTAIYLSYSLHKIIENTDYYFIGMKDDKINFDYSYVLKPSNDNTKAIYVPYKVLDEYLKEIEMNTDLLDVKTMVVPIKNIDDIFQIKQFIKEPFLVYFEPGIEASLSIMNIYQSTFLVQFVSILLVIIVIYKMFDIWKKKKDVALFKMLGVNQKDLIRMRLYEDGRLITMIIGISCILIFVALLLVGLLSIQTFINSMFWIVIYLCIIEFVIMTFYSLVVIKISTAKLFKLNND